jgi:hypothetical protein
MSIFTTAMLLKALTHEYIFFPFLRLHKRIYCSSICCHWMNVTIRTVYVWNALVYVNRYRVYQKVNTEVCTLISGILNLGFMLENVITGLRNGGSWVRMPSYFQNILTVSVSHPTSYLMVTVVSFGGESNRGVKWLRTNGVIFIVPIRFHWQGECDL